MIDWDAVTRDVAYSLAVNEHELFARFERKTTSREWLNALGSFLSLTMPWSYPLFSTVVMHTHAEDITEEMAYWGLTGTAVLVPWRGSTSMQGIGKTTAALYLACAPLTRWFWELDPHWRWLGREPPPFKSIGECVDELVYAGLVVNTFPALKALVTRAEAEGVKYPVVVLDDLSAWASSRDVSVWRRLTSVLTTFRNHVGIAIGTAAALEQVFLDIRRNATMVGEVGMTVAAKTGRCDGIRVNWIRCTDTHYKCPFPRGRRPIDLGLGPMVTVVCEDLADEVRNTQGYRFLSTRLRGELIKLSMMPSIRDLIEVLMLRCPGVDECVGSLDA